MLVQCFRNACSNSQQGESLIEILSLVAVEIYSQKIAIMSVSETLFKLCGNFCLRDFLKFSEHILF